MIDSCEDLGESTVLGSCPAPSAEIRTLVQILRAGFVLVLILYALVLVRPQNYLMDRPLTEDGFYAMSIARHLSLGNGITVDGEQKTNGFQPLWVYLMAVVYSAARFLAVSPERLVLGTHWMIFGSTALMLAWTVSQAVRFRRSEQGLEPLLFWMVAFLYVGAPFTFLHSFNGLETGLYLLTLVVAARVSQIADIYSFSGAGLLGFLLGVCVLARIDAVLLVVAIVTGLVFLPSDAALGRRLALAALLGATAFAVSSPWWFYNAIYFGSPMPSSGSALTSVALSGSRFIAAMKAGLGVAFPWAYHSRLTFHALFFVFAPVALGSLLLLAKMSKSHRLQLGLVLRARSLTTRLFVGSTGGFLLLLAGYYSATSIAVWFYDRYLVPGLLISTPLVAVAASVIIHGWVSQGRRRLGLIVLAGLVLVMVGLSGAQMSYYRGFMMRQQYSSWYLQDQVELVKRHVPDDERVAAWQSGTLGYIRTKVVNLDGKVNADALEHRRRGNLSSYLIAEDIHWICDWPGITEVAWPGEHPGQYGWTLRDKSGIFELWHR